MRALHDVFFSYPRRDLARAQPLLDALATEGVSVWRDQTGLNPGDLITQEILNAIEQSKLFLAFYSAHYPLSRSCFVELSAAWGAAESSGEQPSPRVLLLNPESTFDHIPKALQQREALSWASDPSGLADLARQIRAQVERLDGDLDRNGKSMPPRYCGMSSIAVPRFEGRSRELWDLHGYLTADRMSIITGVVGQVLAQVRGMGGNGKSMLAREYAIRFGAAYPGGVFWLNAYGNDDSEGVLDALAREALRRDQVRDFAVQSGLDVEALKPDEVEAAFWHHLANSGSRCLWVVDDLPSGLATQDIEQVWAARWHGAATLITTRSREYAGIGNGIDLEMLGEEEAIRLLTSRNLPTNDLEKEAAYGIVQALGCHPMAIESAGAYIAGGHADYTSYLALLREPDAGAEDFGAEVRQALPTGHDRSINRTLLYSLRMVGSDGQAFLDLASELAVAAIPNSLVAAAFAEWPEPRPRSVGAIEEIDALGLAQQEDGKSRTVHTLVSRAVRRGLGRSTSPVHWARTAVARALIKLLAAAAQDVRLHYKIRQELVHARHLIAGGLEEPELVIVAAWVARHDFKRGDYGMARVLEEQVVQVCQQSIGIEHPDTLTAMQDLAATIHEQGDLTAAFALEEKILESRRRLFGPEHPDTLISMNNLARTFQAQGNLAGAREMQEKVLQASSRQLGTEHPETLRSMSNLAVTAMSQGDLSRARELLEPLLDARRRLLGRDHSDTLMAANNLATTLQAQGDLSRAQELQKEVFEVSRRVRGLDHPHTWRAAGNLALTLYARGKLDEARELQEQVLAANSRLLGADHADTFRAMNNLAQTTYARGDVTTARGLFEKVLPASQRLLGSEHPDTLTVMNNLAQAVKAQGDVARARALQEQILETSQRLLGIEHPDSTRAAWNLLLTYLESGDTRARAVFEVYISPLFRKDPASLSAAQRTIVQMARQLEHGNPGGHSNVLGWLVRLLRG